MFTTVPVFNDCYGILMEYPPKDLDMKEIRRELISLKGVKSVEDLHVWQLGGGKNCLTAHLMLDGASETTNSINQSSTIQSQANSIQTT